ncbi:MAG: hypothetical protein BWK80_48090 [Desulfobacteraceae bacterium IS3]|nr:MAG: hypothetical protein BWK80_48090 [Desulfobacteraceae bacterium IS3]HAO20176.1 DUF86 domain-containing protein [Desulfobacteraceae bacterium]
MPEPRDYTLFIDDILSAIEKIEKYTQNQTFETFLKNDMATDAVIRNFEIIGEAASHIPKELQIKYPFAEWKEMIGFRNILIHGYFRIEIKTVWDTIKNNIPILKQHIAEIKSALENDSNTED